MQGVPHVVFPIEAIIFLPASLAVEISEGKSSVRIAEDWGMSYPTIFSYTEILLGEVGLDKLRRNGRKAKGAYNYKDGSGVFRNFIQEKCEKCGSTKNLHVHHKLPAKYDENWQAILEGDNSKGNAMTLCASCHQSLHYRELGRKIGPSRCALTGRFLNKEALRVTG